MAATLLCLNSCVIDAKENDETIDYDSQLLQNGEEAADFDIVNDDYPDGLAFSSLRGKYVVLEFWASWCPDCRKVTSTMVELYKAYASDSVVFVGVSFDKNKETWQNYISQNGMVWLNSEPRDKETDTHFDVPYKVRWIPTMYLVGKDGRIIIGTVDENKLKTALEGLVE